MSNPAILTPRVVAANTQSAARRLQVYGVALRVAVASLGMLTLVLFSSLVVSLLAQEPGPLSPATKATPKAAKFEPRPIQPALVRPTLKETPPAAGIRMKQAFAAT